MFFMGKLSFIGNSEKALVVIALHKTVMWSKIYFLFFFTKPTRASFKSMALSILSIAASLSPKGIPKGTLADNMNTIFPLLI